MGSWEKQENMGETGTNINWISTWACQEEWTNEDKDQQNIVIHYLSQNETDKLVMCRGFFFDGTTSRTEEKATKSRCQFTIFIYFMTTVNFAKTNRTLT